MLTAQPVPGINRPSSSNPGLSSRPLSSRPKSKDGEKQAIWVPLLNSASKGKDLPEKQLIVLGGSPDQQRDFLEQLNVPSGPSRYPNNDRRRQPRSAPLSNRYALGYTYRDVLDADQEDVLARLNIYMLANNSASFASLLKPLLQAKTVKDTLITILLDWHEPFKWARQLRQWIRLLRQVILSLDDPTKLEMEEVMTTWKERRVGPDAPSTQPGGTVTADQRAAGATASLGPGEWDEGLGIPLTVVCIQAEKVETLERDHGWGDDQFDFVMQWLRCVLLKHGASLIYTSSFDANNVRTLLHACLSIHSLLKRDVLKHNIVDREKILIPSNWDSWGKIRVLREGFTLEEVANGWSAEIQASPTSGADLSEALKAPSGTPVEDGSHPESESAVQIYEATLPDPSQARASFQPRTLDDKVAVPSVQEFLQTQHDILETLKAEDEKAERKSRKGAPPPTGSGIGASGVEGGSASGTGLSNSRMAEHIGPYQINVNGIDFDADEVTRRLREREQERNSSAKTSAPAGNSGLSTPMRRQGSETGGDSVPTPSGTTGNAANKQSNEAMSQFFANLIKKDKRGAVGPGTSPTRAPGSGSPSVRGGGGAAAEDKTSS